MNKIKAFAKDHKDTINAVKNGIVLGAEIAIISVVVSFAIQTAPEIYKQAVNTVRSLR